MKTKIHASAAAVALSDNLTFGISSDPGFSGLMPMHRGKNEDLHRQSPSTRGMHCQKSMLITLKLGQNVVNITSSL